MDSAIISLHIFSFTGNWPRFGWPREPGGDRGHGGDGQSEASASDPVRHRAVRGRSRGVRPLESLHPRRSGRQAGGHRTGQERHRTAGLRDRILPRIRARFCGLRGKLLQLSTGFCRWNLQL